MRVIAHPDPAVLERELLRRVDAAQANDPLARVLILVPTQRLAAHVQRRLAQASGARLAVEATHPRALALRLLADQGRAVSPASPLLLQALLDRALRRLPSNLWARFAAHRPGARRGLLATVQELREAGLGAAQASAVLRSEGVEAQALAEVYGAYVEALELASANGIADEAELMTAALPLAGDCAGRHALVLHHGAYELTGVHLNLVRALDRDGGLVFLLPCEAGAMAFATAERFAREFLLPPGGELESPPQPTPPGSLLGSRLRLLYKEGDEPAAPPPPPAESVTFTTAQGARSEIHAALLQGLAAVARGAPAGEIAYVARRLAPYQATLESEMEEMGLPWQASAGAPLRREPLAADLLRALALARDDFPRAATAAWITSPRIHWPALVPGQEPPPVEGVDDWSRRAGLLGGLAEWSEDLPAWAPPREAEACHRLAAGLRALSSRCEPGRPRGWRQHAAMVGSLLAEVLPPTADDPDADARGVLAGLLLEMDRLGTVLGEREPVPFAAMVAWLEDAVEQSVRPAPADSGFAVLDAMQARGLTFRHVHLLGLQAGLFPRVAREDPFLPDAARRRLRQAGRSPLPLKLDGDQEERLLLALMLGSATGSLHLSWQRADAQGRAQMPSLALREVGRVALGAADLAAVEARCRRLPAHPAQQLESLAQGTGLLPPQDALLLTALRHDGPEAALAALEASGQPLPPLARQGLEQLVQVESFSRQAPLFDGRIGPAAPRTERVSVTALESLGRCPLQFFFAHVLRVKELEAEVAAEDLLAHEMGRSLHALLESLYRRLDEEGLLSGDPGELVERGEALLAELWPERIAAAFRRPAARLPVLWDHLLASWRDAVACFLREDLPRLRALRPQGLRLEARRERRPPGAERLTVRGRLDRIVELPAGPPLVGDYKTSGKLDEMLAPRAMLRGQRLQVPLYRWLLDDAAEVELLGVGPDFALGGPRAEHRRPPAFAGFDTPAQQEGFAESLEILWSLLRRGQFPLRPGDHCSWCAFRLACRRGHPPTLEREAAAADTADYRRMQRKTTRLPRLQDLPGEEEA